MAITPFEALQCLLEKAGSQGALARVLGVKQPAVHYWINTKKMLPSSFVLEAEKTYGVSRHDLRPDIYPLNYPSSEECLLAVRSNDDSTTCAPHRLSETAK